MAEKTTYLLIDSQVLPDVFLKVVRAKEMLARGTVKSAAMAARACGISRSAFYKYKDSVELFDRGGGSMITLYFSLADEPGVLSAVLSCIYDVGANILTIMQNPPIGDRASVVISMDITGLETSVNGVLEALLSADGVEKAGLIDIE